MATFALDGQILLLGKLCDPTIGPTSDKARRAADKFPTSLDLLKWAPPKWLGKIGSGLRNGNDLNPQDKIKWKISSAKRSSSKESSSKTTANGSPSQLPPLNPKHTKTIPQHSKPRPKPPTHPNTPNLIAELQFHQTSQANPCLNPQKWPSTPTRPLRQALGLLCGASLFPTGLKQFNLRHPHLWTAPRHCHHIHVQHHDKKPCTSRRHSSGHLTLQQNAP